MGEDSAPPIGARLRLVRMDLIGTSPLTARETLGPMFCDPFVTLPRTEAEERRYNVLIILVLVNINFLFFFFNYRCNLYIGL